MSTDNVSPEEQELRSYMQTFGGLNNDRSTYSYALEFLRTAHSNLLLYQAKANITRAALAIEMWMKYVDSEKSSMQKSIEFLREHDEKHPYKENVL